MSDNYTQDFIDEVKGCRTPVISGEGGVDIEVREALDIHTKNADIHTSMSEVASTTDNYNFIINPNFRVNQKNIVSVEVASDSYTRICDMWKAKSTSGSGLVITMSDDGVTLSNNCAMIQIFEDPSVLNGETFTLSAMIDGEVISGTFVWNGSSNYGAVVNGDVILAYSGTTKYVQVYNVSGANVVVNWVKLERGSMSTNFAAPVYAEELVKCQRYYQVRTTGDINPVDLRPSMRVNPTVTELDSGNYSYNAEL